MNWIITGIDHVRNGIIAHVWADMRGGVLGYSWDVGSVDPYAPRVNRGFEPTLDDAKLKAEVIVLELRPQEVEL